MGHVLMQKYMQYHKDIEFLIFVILYMYKITAVLKVETFKTDVNIFIDNIIMCLTTSH